MNEQKLLPAPDKSRYIIWYKQPAIDLTQAIKDWEEIQRVQRIIVEEVLKKMFEG